MKDNFFETIENIWKTNLLEYITNLQENPLRIIALIIDVTIVVYLIYKLIKITRNTRVWQLMKGIGLLIILTLVSGWIHLDILHSILTSIMTYGVIAMIVIFQPELRRGLEQLGTNKFTRFFGIDKDLTTRTKEDIYKIVIAAEELASTKTGALIVIERDIKLGDIIDTGIPIDSEISPQLLVNIFVPNTPLHDGAALGISKETDCIAIVVSEETGKISIAKDGNLIADIDEEMLKKLLIKNLIKKKLEEKSGKIKSKFFKKKE